MEKLVRDLDTRNYLIDQLNDESMCFRPSPCNFIDHDAVNRLKAEMMAIIRRENGDSREGLVDK